MFICCEYDFLLFNFLFENQSDRKTKNSLNIDITTDIMVVIRRSAMWFIGMVMINFTLVNHQLTDLKKQAFVSLVTKLTNTT